jgi:hypothetical protein
MVSVTMAKDGNRSMTNNDSSRVVGARIALAAAGEGQRYREPSAKPYWTGEPHQPSEHKTQASCPSEERLVMIAGWRGRRLHTPT